MDRHIRGIDHLLVGVRDLAAAAASWQRLGFTTTPLGRHVGWTTANVCVMLETGYIELLGMLDPSGVRHDIAAFLERGEGGMGLALASDDAAATAAGWRNSGIAIRGPEALRRRMEDGTEAVELRFLNVTPELPDLAGFVLFACFHETPELLRRPEWLRHANGAVRLRSCTLLADPPEAVTQALARLLGEDTVANTDQVTAFHLGAQSIIVAPVEDVRLFHPALGQPQATAVPRLVAAEIEVADLDQTRHHLEREGVPFSMLAEILAVDPAAAGGLALEFVPAARSRELA